MLLVGGDKAVGIIACELVIVARDLASEHRPHDAAVRITLRSPFAVLLLSVALVSQPPTTGSGDSGQFARKCPPPHDLVGGIRSELYAQWVEELRPRIVRRILGVAGGFLVEH